MYNDNGHLLATEERKEGRNTGRKEINKKDRRTALGMRGRVRKNKFEISGGVDAATCCT